MIPMFLFSFTEPWSLGLIYNEFCLTKYFLWVYIDCIGSELDMHGPVCICNTIQDRMGLLHQSTSTHLRDQIVGRSRRNGICTSLYVGCFQISPPSHGHLVLLY